MWWVLPTILAVIVLAIAALLWCVVHCARYKFAPEGTRGPKERAEWGDSKGQQPRYIGPTGPSWKLPDSKVGPINVYTTYRHTRMPIKRPECHQRTIRRIIEDATRKPVRIRPAWAWDRARTDAPYYFGWLPTELSNKVIHPQNFITVEGGLHLPSSMNVAERGAMFRYVDDLLTMRLVNRAFAYRYKSTACVHALRRMMHARAHTRTQDMHWMFGMHCTALLMTRMAPTVEEQGVVALQLLKTVVVARMMQEMRGADVQPTVSEMAAQMPSTIPRFT